VKLPALRGTAAKDTTLRRSAERLAEWCDAPAASRIRISSSLPKWHSEITRAELRSA